LLLEFVISAADLGAEVANYVEAIDFTRQGNQVTGAQVRDLQSGQVFEIQARMVVNCAGAWVDNLLEKVSLHSDCSTSIAMNIIVDKVWSDVAAGLPSQPSDGRLPQILFFVPWRNVTMIGTWHIPWNEAADTFKLNDDLIQNFLDEINSAHPQLRLTLEDVRHVTWGFLPVNKEDAYRKPVRLTRDSVLIDHEKDDNLRGLISALGVKYTTARVTAEKVIDLILEKLNLNAKKCQTHLIPVNGGRIEDFNVFMKRAKAETSNLLETKTIEHLVYSYGSEYQNLVQNIIAQPELAEQIDVNLPVTKAEIVHAIRHEMALTLTDVIQRRTELGATGLPSVSTLQSCAELMANELGWSFDRQAQEVESLVQSYKFKQMEGVIV